MTQDIACFAFMFSALSVMHSRRGAGPGAERLGETEHSRENHVGCDGPCPYNLS